MRRTAPEWKDDSPVRHDILDNLGLPKLQGLIGTAAQPLLKLLRDLPWRRMAREVYVQYEDFERRCPEIAAGMTQTEGLAERNAYIREYLE